MSLAEFGRLLRRGAWLIVVLVVAGGLAGLAVAATQPPQYQASATLLVTAAPQGSASDGQGGNQLAQARAQLLVQLATTDAVLEVARTSLGGSTTVSALRTSVSASSVDSTNFTTVTATAATPRGAVDTASAVVSALRQVASSLDTAQTRTGSTAEIVISEVTAPALPTRAFAPQPRNLALAGAVAGLALAIIVLIVRDIVSQRVRSALDLQLLEPGLLVTAVERPGRLRGGRRADRAEAFRILRAVLLPLLASRSVIAVIGATDDTSVDDLGRHLAAAIEEIGGTALVVDARPVAVAREAAAAAAERSGGRALRSGRAGGAVRVVPFGQLSEHSAELVERRGAQALADPSFGAHLTAASATAQYLIVLLPAVSAQASAGAAAAAADAVVLQVDAGRTKRGEALLALQRLRSAGAREIVGTVVGTSKRDSLPALPLR